MKESMYRYFKPGIIHFMAYPVTMKGEGPIVETIRKIASDGYFCAIEITWIKDPAVRREVKEILDESHLTVTYGAQPRFLTTGLNINDLNEEGRQKALATLKEGVDEAYEMGAQGLAFLSGKYEEATKEQSYRMLVESTKEICAYAQYKGSLRIELEVFDYDVDKKSIIGPAPLAKRFGAEMRYFYPDFGLLVDLSHFPLLHETIEESVIPLREYITHAHMGNTVVGDPSFIAYGDTHPRFGFPHGSNDVGELARYLKVLMDVGFLNEKNPPVLSFEVKPQGNEDPDVVIANGKRVLNEAWAKV